MTTKKFLSFLLISFGITFSQEISNYNLSINNLDELTNSHLYNNDIYLLGTVNPLPDSIIFNDTKAMLLDNGAYLVYTQLNLFGERIINRPDTAQIDISIWKDNQRQNERVVFPVFIQHNNFSNSNIEIDSSWNIKPSGNYLIKENSFIDVELRATPGSNAYVMFNNDTTKYTFTECSFENDYYWGEAVFGDGMIVKNHTPLTGIYKRSLQVKYSPDTLTLTAYIENAELGTKTFNFPARISVMKSGEYRIAETLNDPNLITGRFAPAKGYKLFLQEGIKLKIDAIENGWVKSELNNDNPIYLPQSAIKFLPDNFTPPNSEIQAIRIKTVDSGINLQFGLTEKVPVEVKQFSNPVKYQLTFYNTTANIDWVINNDAFDFIDDVKHYQSGERELTVVVTLKRKYNWGYQSFYDGSIFNFNIKRTPEIENGFLFGGNSLAGKRISIDPGHNPESGAVGPTGLAEKDINYTLSKKLADALQELDAEVFLTRERNEPLPLRQRRQRVLSFKPDVSISIHNNAVPQNVNPIKHNGFSVYYYYDQAKPLAELVHKMFQENLDIPDFGLYWDNLYMCRITEVPSILVEPSFIIHPSQEKLLRTEKFQNAIVNSIVEALKEYFEDYSK